METNIYWYIRIFSLDILIVPYKVIVSKNIENLRKVEDIGRITVVYHRSQAIYIEEGFFLDKKDLYKNRYYFERNKETIKENDAKKRERCNNLGVVIKKEQI